MTCLDAHVQNHYHCTTQNFHIKSEDTIFGKMVAFSNAMLIKYSSVFIYFPKKKKKKSSILKALILIFVTCEFNRMIYLLFV